MTDFYVNNDGIIFVLNSTEVLQTFTLLESSTIKFVKDKTITLDSYIQYLSLDCEVDYKLPKDYYYSLLLSTNSEKNNIHEYIFM